MSGIRLADRERMSAIEAIGNAVRYDAAESMLARGASLNEVLAFVASQAQDAALDNEVSPASFRPTVKVEVSR